MRKRVLIISYYWPPSGGSGVQRWLKFVKYLAEYDLDIVIYTAQEDSYTTLDPSLENDLPEGIEVIRSKVLEPARFLSVFGKKNAKGEGFLNPNPGRVERFSRYVRANYFIPDARKMWIKPSVRKLSTYLKEKPVDLMITTGPPHSLHLMGLKLKEKFNIPWISDFRDPWSKIDYFHSLPLTDKSLNKHKSLEQAVVKKSDKVLVIGKSMQEDFLKFNPETHVITNGYDVDVEEKAVELDKKFSIVHIGMLNADRNQKMLWKVLSELKAEDSQFSEDLEIKFIGKACAEAREQIEEFGLVENLNDIGYIPHNDVHSHQRSSQVLLLLVNRIPAAKGVITGKIFEYLVAQRPILAIGPTDGDLSEILNETKAGDIVAYDDEAALRKSLLESFSKYKENQLWSNSSNTEQYHRKELTKKLYDHIKELI